MKTILTNKLVLFIVGLTLLLGNFLMSREKVSQIFFLFNYLLMTIFPFYRVDFPVNEIPVAFEEVYYENGYPHNINVVAPEKVL